VSSLTSFPLVIHEGTWRELADLAEALAKETLAVEHELLDRPELHAKIALPRPLRPLFARGSVPTPSAARVMRFDFHEATDGWRISEVNADVPGGFTEATSFTRLVASRAPGARPAGDPTAAVVESIAHAIGERGAVALVNAPGHMEDHQVTSYLASRLRSRGLAARVCSLSSLRFREGRADGFDAIVRFYQVEWLARLPRSATWRPLFSGGLTPVANPGVAALSESKRLPLVWDELRTPLPTWRRVLPETRALADAPWSTSDDWLLKTAYSNTGDTVSIRETMNPAEWRRRAWLARLRPSQWMAQRRFAILPIVHEGETFYPCIGVYTVNGIACGAYARLSKGPIVDMHARDAALLVTSAAS
jgi:glutathionylspermidine synthase